ncbi:MAG: carboxypeptidase regulatory-like domain-containing protein, partial [Gemmatimonadales bacterium]
MASRLSFALAALGIVLLSLAPVAAQTTTGQIRGFVRNQNGVALEGAQLQARNIETGVARSVSTRPDGSYVLPGLAPGTYDLSVRHIGSAPQQRRVRVQIGATHLADFTLTAGAVELQAVTVEAATPIIETRTSEIATNVTSQQVEQLPTRSRNFLDLAALAPGVTVTEDRLDFTGRRFSAGAQGANDVNVFIDGASLKNDLTGGGVAGQDASRG